MIVIANHYFVFCSHIPYALRKVGVVEQLNGDLASPERLCRSEEVVILCILHCHGHIG